ncbi:MAG TPA: hypothetical protein VIL86_08505 [Tepidisphaeraceae bacterium]|jgi:hypothetical protein
MVQSELLSLVVEVLERLRLPYFVTGSLITMHFGEPRFTNDIDIVVALSMMDVHAFCAAFPADDFYVSSDAVRSAVREKGQFNIIHPNSGLKVDVMVPPDTPFNRSRFQRALRVRPRPDYDAAFSSPEDAIIMKMLYYREGGSEKHLRDITGVLKISGAVIDREYIARWAAEFEVMDIWEEILQRVPQP